MTTPDLRAAGLDPAHILTVCEHVAESAGHPPIGYVTTTPDGVRVRVRPVQAARQMQTALTQLGYATQLRRPGRQCELLVTGWNSDALEARLAAMRTVIAQLTADPTATAAAVIGRYRDLSARAPIARLGVAALIQVGDELRATVAARCGICIPHNPAILPPEIGDALRLRAIWLLEQAIAELTERQLRTARRALVLFRTHRQHTTDDRARTIAIAQAASPVLRPRGPASADRTAADAPLLWAPKPADPPASGRVGWSPAGPAPQAMPRFPTHITDVISAAAAEAPGDTAPSAEPRGTIPGPHRR